MKNFTLGILSGIILGVIGGWYYLSPPPSVPSIETIQRQTEDVAEDAAEGLQAKLEALDLTSEDIQEELEQKGRIIRRNARELGDHLTDTAEDAGITTTIRTKYLRDPELSVWDISVSTINRKVTLSGRVGSPRLLAKAMLYALQTEHVDMVVSSLQVAKESGEETS